MSEQHHSANSKIEVRVTADGSPTLYVPALDEHYHSRHGARQESEHVFIRAGLAPLLQAGGPAAGPPWRVLEVGLGTGLNALLTLQALEAAGPAPTADPLEYDALETLPLPPAVVAALQPEWDQQGPPWAGHFAALHAAPWNVPVALTPEFTLTKMQQPLQEAHLVAGRYHLIYFDAFAPRMVNSWCCELGSTM